MNINDFKSHVDKTILNRGYDYYIEGNIVESYKNKDNEYIFVIEGNEEYEVVVKIDDNGEIIYSHCDCPYDFGPICKHEVASYYELDDILNSRAKTTSGKKEKVEKLELNDVLNTLSKEELITIIEYLAEKDSFLKESLIFKYSKGDDEQELKKCKKLIDSVVGKYLRRGRFIPYDETYDFICDMEEVLEKARETEDSLLALDITFLLLNEAVEAFQYADDSDGWIGSLVSNTLEAISDIVMANQNLNIREKMFNKLLQMSDSKIFDEWEEYKHDIFRICSEFADVEEFRNKLVAKIKGLLDKYYKDEYKRYSAESLLKLLFHIINEYGTKEEADKFIVENLKFTYFRELLIDKYFKEKNYNGVIELAMQGEKQDVKYAGLIIKWKELRYRAYKEQGLKEEQEKLAKELFLNGKFDYYEDLKELAREDKTAFYNNLKRELKNDEGWHGRSLYLRIIVEEKDTDEIMEYVRENPRTIEEYIHLLIDKYRDEVMEIYIKSIKLQASSASNRNGYKAVCGTIKRYKKIFGNKNIEGLINELTALYKKRPAFLDELRKIR